MTLQDVETLLDYHYWARDRLLSALEPLSCEELTRDLGGSFPTVRDTVAHIFGAEVVWFARWQGEVGVRLPSPDRAFPDLTTLRVNWSDHEQKLRAFVTSLGDAGIQRVFSYQLFNGQQAASPLWQMLHHVVNHASYHRGQVVTSLRQLGAAPPASMDAITFYRAL